MKTFYFNPKGYGNTYVVMAENYDDAFKYVWDYCEKHDELDLFKDKLTYDVPYIELKEGEVFQGCTC